MRLRYILLFTIWLLLLGLCLGVENRKMPTILGQSFFTEFQQRSLSRGFTEENRMLTAFVCIRQKDGDEILEKHHCQKLAQWDDIYIASIPLTQLEALASEPAVMRIEARQSCHLCIDTTAVIVQAQPVYESSATHQAFTGKDVVIGMVDVGFDLTHPNFLDAQNGSSRIKAFWDQLSPDTIGSQLPVGRDYLGAGVISAVRHSTDGDTQTHGTHTMGIAAGSGYDTAFRGIAYESDLCIVGNLINDNLEYVDSADYYKYTTATDALAFKYCFDYAEQQGKPCVVSFSEGYTPYLDEDDSLFAATLSHIVGPGKIIVASAGNEGVEKTYFEKDERESAAGSFVRSFKESAYYRIKSEGEMRLVVYGYRKEIGIPSDTIAFETDEVPIDTILSRKIAFGSDSLTMMVYRDASSFTHHDVWQVLLKSDSALNQLAPLALVVEGGGKIEVYGSSTNAFHDDAADHRWNAALVGRNIFAPGCFQDVICVGATTHRQSIRNAAGLQFSGSKEEESGKIGYYSSTGPAMNDLMKPDVVAPGTNVVSSYSLFYHPEKEVVGYSDYGGERYPWGVNTGTSMSTPVVAGVIALWLQAKPDLSPQDVMEVLKRSCSFPEKQFEYPNNVYGYGEIDAYRGLMEVLSLSDIGGISLHQPKGVHVIPLEGRLRLVFEDVDHETPLLVRIYDLSGRCVYTSLIETAGSETIVALPNMTSGVYAVQVDVENGKKLGSVLVRF